MVFFSLNYSFCPPSLHTPFMLHILCTTVSECCNRICKTCQKPPASRHLRYTRSNIPQRLHTNVPPFSVQYIIAHWMPFLPMFDCIPIYVPLSPCEISIFCMVHLAQVSDNGTIFFCCAKDANSSNDISATFKGHSRLTWKYHWMKLEPMSVEAHIQQWNMIDDYHLWNANIGLLIGIKWQLEWKECFVGFPHNSRWKWFNLLMSNRRNKHRNRPVQSAASTPCAVVSWPNVMRQNTHPIHFRIWPTINIAGITRHSYIQRLARYRGSWTKQQPLTSNEWIGAILCYCGIVAW